MRQKRENQRDGTVRWTWLHDAGFEDGARGHKPRKVADF